MGRSGEIPADSDVAKLGVALAAGARGNLYELVANAAAYSGLRWGELAALTIPQIDSAARAISVDRKIVEVAGQLYLEAPKNRKRRRTIYPRRTPAGYPLADRLASRIEEARAEQEAGANPLGLIFPSIKGRYWRSSNFNRRVLAPAYRAVGWRDAGGNGAWTWHSLRHVFCTTALFTWKLDPTDVSAWPATPTTAPRSTCTSAAPPDTLTAPNNLANAYEATEASLSVEVTVPDAASRLRRASPVVQSTISPARTTVRRPDQSASG